MRNSVVHLAQRLFLSFLLAHVVTMTVATLALFVRGKVQAQPGSPDRAKARKPRARQGGVTCRVSAKRVVTRSHHFTDYSSGTSLSRPQL